MAQPKMTEFWVASVMGQSPAGGDPDTIANTYLENWGLVARNGESVHKGAVPKDDLREKLRFKVWGDEPDIRCALFLATEPSPAVLDRGKFVSKREIPDEPGTFEFVMEGTYLFRLVVRCGPKPKSKSSQQASDLGVAKQIPISTEALEAKIGFATTPDMEMVVGAILDIPLNLIRRMPGQPRKYFDQEELEQFGRHLKEMGQLQPAIVRKLPESDPDGRVFELISGERRWRASSVAGIPCLKAIVRDGPVDEVRQFAEAVIANCHNVDLSILETIHSVGYLAKNGKSDDEIARLFGKKSAVWAYQHRRALTLEPGVLALLGPETPEEKRLPLSCALLLVGLPAEEQTKYAKMTSKAGLSAKKLSFLIKKARESHGIGVEKSPSERFKEASSFFRVTNEGIESIMDLSEAQITASLRGRSPERVKALLDTMKDCVDNLPVLYRAFERCAVAARVPVPKDK